MHLPIETWLTDAGLPEESLVAFNESVLAFKTGANRAALLFSYVAWGLALRDRLLKAPGPPTGLQQGQWDAIMRDLRNDDTWDTQVFGCTQMKTPAPIFLVSEDVRAQVRYWKDRRNDCAHFKMNEIAAAHVDSFWAFVRSNLGRFVPLGSEASTITAILRHFDPNQTPPGADLMPLVRRIPESITPERLKPFLLDVRSALTTNVGTLKLSRSAEVNLLLAAGVSGGGQLGRAALEVMLDDHALLVGVVRMWPDCVAYLSDYPEHVRRLWRKDLFDKNHADLPVFGALVRNALIPDDQLSEANSRAVLGLRGDLPLQTDVDALNRSGFFAALHDAAFSRGLVDQFAWGNANAATIAWYILNFPLDDVIVASICETFDKPPYPSAVEAMLQEVLAPGTPKRLEFENISQRSGRPVPSCLG
jgi:hypothetical protein